MSGHSKWHNIQAKKGKADAARGKIFTKLGREIAVAARNNPNPSTNSKLADVIAKAKAANMPNDNIERSIKRAAGELGDRDYKELTYEGYGVGGAAVIMFSSIVMSGIQLITRDPLTPRSMSIVAVALGLGYGLGANSAVLVGLPQWVQLVFGGSGIVPAAFVAIVMNLLLPKEKEA